MTARRFPPPWSVEELDAWNVGMVSRYHPPSAFRSLDSEAVSYAHGDLRDLSHCTPPIRSALCLEFTFIGPKGQRPC